MTILISDDPKRLDIPMIHQFLHEEAGWAKDIPLTTVEKAIQHSLCFGAYENGNQVGFARVVTDRASYAYLCDVFTIPSHRGRGIARLLMETILNHPDIHGLRKFNLGTSSAQGLYEKFGWVTLNKPETNRERHSPGAYEMDDEP